MKKRALQSTAVTFIFIIIIGGAYLYSAMANNNTWVAAPLWPPNIVVDNNKTLTPFLKKLRLLDKTKVFNRPVASPIVGSIVHLGDSHIQAGFLSGKLRSLLQSEFGNAGRGLVVPLRLAYTNEPSDYKITSSCKWTAAKMVQPSNSANVGVGGISLSAKDTSIDFLIENLAGDEHAAFDAITIFHAPTSSEVTADSHYDLKLRCQERDYTTHIILSESVNNIKIISNNSGDDHFYGFNLQNSKSGILYHSIGINGAYYENYCKSTNMTNQLEALSPELVIISLGTNEASLRRFDLVKINSDIDQFAKQIKATLPEATLLLVTPAVNYKLISRKYVENPNLQLVSSAIINYAQQNGLAYWDLYSLTKQSNDFKSNSELFAKDRVHYTEEGYNKIADLLYSAIMNSYKEHIKSDVL